MKIELISNKHKLPCSINCLSLTWSGMTSSLWWLLLANLRLKLQSQVCVLTSRLFSTYHIVILCLYPPIANGGHNCRCSVNMQNLNITWSCSSAFLALASISFHSSIPSLLLYYATFYVISKKSDYAISNGMKNLLSTNTDPALHNIADIFPCRVENMSGVNHPFFPLKTHFIPKCSMHTAHKSSENLFHCGKPPPCDTRQQAKDYNCTRSCCHSLSPGTFRL